LILTGRQQDKAVILASDGLWDVVSESEAVSAVSTSLGGSTAELKVRAGMGWTVAVVQCTTVLHVCWHPGRHTPPTH
jgi:serine/threonine protein phosphatase PrpC